MPEGDTIYRTAVQLRKAIEGQTVQKGECHNPRFEGKLNIVRLINQVCTRVEARGKHLLMHLGSGDCLHSHMGMTGSWHLYQPQEKWQKPLRQASLELSLSDWTIVCFNPKQLELLSADRLRQHRQLQMLGPDLLDAKFDVEAAIQRFRTWNDCPLGEAVMNQSIVCGIGNVYKSESLFLEKLNPFAPVSALSDEQLRSMLNQARKLMLRNLAGYPRQTRFDGVQRSWIYRRSNQACPKCGTTVQMQRQGDQGRSTYWCPACQSCNATQPFSS